MKCVSLNKGDVFSHKGKRMQYTGSGYYAKTVFWQRSGEKVHTMLELDDEIIEHRLLREQIFLVKAKILIEKRV